MISSPFSSAEGEISETGPVQLVSYKKRVMISSHSLDLPLFENELFFFTTKPKNMFDLLFQVRLCPKMYVRKLYCCDAGVEHLTDIFYSETKFPIMRT